MGTISQVITYASLRKLTKPQLCDIYRQMGGLGGMYPPEKWRKDEVIDAILNAQLARAEA